MKNPLLVPELRELLASGQDADLNEFCADLHPAAVADLVSALDPREAWAVLKHAVPLRRAEIFSHLDEDAQIEVVSLLRRDELARLFSDMPPDDRAHLFRRLPEERQDLVMPALAQAEREDIRRLMSYEEGTAGAIMTSDYATLTPEMTVADAIDRLRQVAPDKETIYYSYVIDERRRLIGFVSLRDLILARRDMRIGDILHDEVILARSDEDQEEAARKIQKYDLIALPVVNAEDALVGIITYDDAIDVITQEHTEDMEKLMAIAGSHEEGMYMRTSSWGHFRNRAGWVVALAVVGMASGFIVQRFEGLLRDLTILAAFMPMLADTGGNTGSQSATLVIRALALKEIQPRDLLRILLKEARVALMLGALLGVMAFGRVMLYPVGNEPIELVWVGFAISLALGMQVVTSTLFGALLPIVAAKLKLDPALVASPALTTVVDVTGLLIYFTIVKLVLGV